MTFETGTMLGHYKIISSIGAGGMGEVYRARDERLDREVAIKVLPEDFAKDKDRLRRFEQEAKATSALNHPNILTIYDVGDQDGRFFIVEELLDGEELRSPLNLGPISLRKAIDHAQQIVSGLTAAHEKGIIHRDLKPENIFITSDERIKILDFGLAKLREKALDHDGSEDATRKAITDPGVVMGTVGYMSPEQVRGQIADHRSDIFSFGAVLHEMITGQRAFQRETMAETMSAILKEEPEDLTVTNPNINPGLERIVCRCLEKRPERRFQSTADLGFALEALSAPTTSSGSRLTLLGAEAVADEKTSLWSGRLPWIIASSVLLVALAAVIVAAGYLRQAPVSPIKIAVLMAPPEKSTGFGQLAISPDGRNLVFFTTFEGRQQLWLRPMDALAARPLPGSESTGGFPFWSPDGRWVAFASGAELKKIDLQSGTVQKITDVGSDIRGFSGTWNRDGTILFFLGASGLMRVSANGGQPEVVPGYESSPELLNRWPQFMPDGRHFVYLATTTGEASDIMIGSLDNSTPKKLFSAQSNAVYVGTSSGPYLLFARNNVLLAQEFDANNHTVSGEPIPIAEQVRVNQNGRVFLAASDNGTLIYDPNAVGESRQLTWFDRTGRALGTFGPLGTYQRIRLSPDEKRVAASQRNVNGMFSIEVIDIARGASSPLTSGIGDTADFIWSPDGSRIAWAVRQGASNEIHLKFASGAGQEEVLLRSDLSIGISDWSADGKYILYSGFEAKTRQDIWVFPLEGDRKPDLFFQTPAGDSGATFSPDGRFIAYTSGESGRPEVYVQTFPPSSGKWPISTNGGLNVSWRADGRELFYNTLDGKVMSVEVKLSPTFEPGLPKQLFDLAVVRTTPNTSYAVSADGQRFLFISRQDAPSTLAVVVNWAADLKR